VLLRSRNESLKALDYALEHRDLLRGEVGVLSVLISRLVVSRLPLFSALARPIQGLAHLFVVWQLLRLSNSMSLSVKRASRKTVRRLKSIRPYAHVIVQCKLRL
jgi:hypothetical protein